MFFHNIENLLNLSAKALGALHRLKIYNLRDLLFYIPHSYQIKNINPNLSNLKQGELIQAEVRIEEVNLGRGRAPTKILVSNNTGKLLLIFFNPIPAFIFNRLVIGSKHIICGKVQFFEDVYQINHPEFIFKKELEGFIEPLYSLTYGITNKQLYNYIYQGFEFLKDEQSDHIISNLKILHLYNFKDEIGKIFDLWAIARKALSKFELIANQASLKLMRSKRSNMQKTTKFLKNLELQSQILHRLNFELTTSQQEALDEIEKDQTSNLQMMRLLQGDVGSGKTLVALLTIVNVISRGFQATLMAPTDLLASQHYEFFQKALGQDFKDQLGLLTGKTTQKERKILSQELEPVT